MNLHVLSPFALVITGVHVDMEVSKAEVVWNTEPRCGRQLLCSLVEQEVNVYCAKFLRC